MVLRGNVNTVIGKYPFVTQFIKGVFKLPALRPTYHSTWDVGIVVNYLRDVDNKSCLTDVKVCYAAGPVYGNESSDRASNEFLTLLQERINVHFAIDKILKTSRPGHSNIDTQQNLSYAQWCA